MKDFLDHSIVDLLGGRRIFKTIKPWTSLLEGLIRKDNHGDIQWKMHI